MNPGLVMTRKSIFEAVTQDPIRLNLMILKSKLVSVIVDMIKSNGWTQKLAAEKLTISQPRISNLYKGKLDKFSIDFLLEILLQLGYKLELNYRPSSLDQPMDMALKKAVL